MSRVAALIVGFVLTAVTAPFACAKDKPMPHTLAGRVTVDGAAARGVEISLVAETGDVLAAAVSDDAGHYRLASVPAAAGARRWLLAKLERPIVGVVARPVADEATVDVAETSARGVRLRVQLEPPSGTTADPVEVMLTPRELPTVPASVARAIPLVGMGGSMRSAYHSVVAHGSPVEVRVLPAAWELAAGRHGDDSTRPPFDPGPPRLDTAALRLPDGKRVPATLGACRLAIDHDVTITLELRVAD